MKKIKEFFDKITNGIVLIIIGLLHTHFTFSEGGFGKQFAVFSEKYFFTISKGMADLPAAAGKTDFETFSAFWFFYFGILIIPLGLLVNSFERRLKALPSSFTVSYLIVVLIGVYMIPNSGITIFMLPQAIYMLFSNYYKIWKQKKNNSQNI